MSTSEVERILEAFQESKMKNYELYARKYPAIVGMLLPALLTGNIIVEYIPQYQATLSSLFSKLGAYIPIVIVYGALGFFLRSLFRDASKLLFQFPLFKEDETEMPTTQLLLHQGKKRLSNSMINQVKSKVKKDFGIILLNVVKERQNPLEAKRTIVDAVGKIRECTRKNPILHQYNIDFGFYRNYLGATVYALLFLMIILIVNLISGYGVWQYTLLAIFLQFFLGVIAFVTLKFKGYAYARALFNAYLSNVDYELE